jgi:TolB-like protein
VGVLLLPALLADCQFYEFSAPPADYYYLNPHKKLSAIGRTALVDLDNDSSYPEISADITEALYQALQKRQLFGLTVVHASNPMWRSLQLPPNSTYNLEQLSSIRRALKCDAVLTGTITEYRPYPHMVVGLRLRLVDLKDGQLIWAIEQIWDSSDKTTENRIKKYLKSQTHSSSSHLGKKLVTVSSLKFIKFVAYEVAQTL